MPFPRKTCVHGRCCASLLCLCLTAALNSLLFHLTRRENVFVQQRKRAAIQHWSQLAAARGFSAWRAFAAASRQRSELLQVGGLTQGWVAGFYSCAGLHSLHTRELMLRGKAKYGSQLSTLTATCPCCPSPICTTAGGSVTLAARRPAGSL